ncbi:MAG: hypothetical protein ACREKE_00755 [bacterium]
MIRRLLLAAALVVAAGRLAHAAACLPIGAGPVLNGFETTGTACTNDIGEWGITSYQGGVTLNPSTANATFNPVQGSTLGYVAASAEEILSLTITTASCPALAANSDWSTPNYGYLFVAYQSLTGTTSFYYQFQLVDGGNANAFRTSGNISGAATFSYLITSLNYARNIGYDVGNVSQVSLTTLGPIGGLTDPIGIGYDDLQVGTAAGLSDTANTPVLASDVTGSAGGCDTPVTLTWTVQTQSGTDPISGYHIYRSVTGPTGPFISDGYVVGAGTVDFTDAVSGESATEYFEILPYSSTTANFGGSGLNGVYTGCKSATYDSVWGPADGGVNEAALVVNGTYVVGPIDALGGCTPTDTPTLTSTATPTATASGTPTATPTATPTVSPSDTATITPTATPTETSSDTPTATLTGTPTYSASATDTPSATPSATITLSFTASLTSTLTPTASPTSTTTATATPSGSPTDTATATPSLSPSDTSTPTPSFSASPSMSATATPSLTATPSATSSASPTASPTFTISPTFTPNPGGGGHFWPNPFYPDRNTRLFHLGDVAPGQKWQVFNMIGQLVWQSTTEGNPDYDVWDGRNSNGVEVTTGVYLLYMDGKIYRFAVVRN